MENTIETSKNTLFLHIIKKNLGYLGICTNSEIEHGSVHFFKFAIKNCEFIDYFDIQEDYAKMREIYEIKKQEYEKLCESKIKSTVVLDEDKYGEFCSIQKRDARRYGNTYREDEDDKKRFMKTVVTKPEKDADDFAFSEITDIYRKLAGYASNAIEKIKAENIKRRQEYDNKIEKALSFAVNTKFNEFMKTNNLPAPKKPRYCEICDKNISYTNWSTHITSDKHANREEYNAKQKAKSTKVLCVCGSKVLPRCMNAHLRSDKHNGIEPKKINCECGMTYSSRFEKTHLTSVIHRENMAKIHHNEHNF